MGLILMCTMCSGFPRKGKGGMGPGWGKGKKMGEENGPGKWAVKGKEGKAVQVDESDNKDWEKVECKRAGDCKYVSEKGSKCYRECDGGYCDANEVSCSGPKPSGKGEKGEAVQVDESDNKD